MASHSKKALQRLRRRRRRVMEAVKLALSRRRSVKNRKMEKRMERSMHFPSPQLDMGKPVFGEDARLFCPLQNKGTMIRNAVILQEQEKRKSKSLRVAMAVGEELLGENWTMAGWGDVQKILGTIKERHMSHKHGLALSHAIAALSLCHSRSGNATMSVTALWDKKEGRGENQDALILEILLHRLSVLQIFQLRLVCKSWNIFLRSPSLLKDTSSPGDFDDTWIIMGRVGWRRDCLLAYEFSAYSFLHRRWLHLPLDSSSNPGMNAHLGASYCLVASRACWFPSSFVVSAAYISADAAGGLMCFLLDDRPAIFEEVDEELCESKLFRNHLSVLVCNPVTGASRHLRVPTTRKGDDAPQCIAMSTCKGEAGYCIIVYAKYGDDINEYEDLDYRPKRMLMYRSKTERWSSIRRTRFVSQDIAIEDMLNMGHFITHTSFGLKAFNINLGFWMTMDLPDPSGEDYSDVFYFEWRNSLHAVDVDPFTDGEIINHAIYRLDHSTTENTGWTWTMLSTTRNMLDKGITLKIAIAKYNLVCISFYTCLIDPIVHLVYNLETGDWYRLPPYKGSHSYAAIAVFRPQLHAVV